MTYNIKNGKEKTKEMDYNNSSGRIIVIHILSIFPFQFLCCTSFPYPSLRVIVLRSLVCPYLNMTLNKMKYAKPC